MTNATGWMTNRWMTTAALALLLGGAGCAEPVDGPTDVADSTATSATGGKSDEAVDGRLLDTLEILNRENTDGESETLRLVGEVSSPHDFEIEQGTELQATLRAMDGGDFSISTTLVYEEEGVGAFLSETVDVSELLPYRALRVDVTGEHDGGEVAQSFDFVDGAELGVEVIENDPFEEAYDVDAGIIYLDPSLPAPSYQSARVDGAFGLGGTEFWQKWEGGHNPTYSYSAGTEAGQKCMYASARRFEAIMADPPPALVELQETSNWSGRFFNWNDDYSHEDARGEARYAALWAWRTTLIKWISQTGKDGACHLPTYSTVEAAADTCLAKAAANEGEIEGCQAM